MQGVDVEQVRERAREIRESITKVHRYVAQPDAEFFADERNLYTVMHLLLIAIEAIAAICSHVLAKTARRAPSSYADCFEGLEHLGILDRDLTGRLIRMARFRNLLIHRYWEIDPQRVLLYARENLDDLEMFLIQMGRWLGQELYPTQEHAG
jgi:uncharacterized protein YutE (UPF0331/DUF86 family)